MSKIRSFIMAAFLASVVMKSRSVCVSLFRLYLAMSGLPQKMISIIGKKILNLYYFLGYLISKWSNLKEIKTPIPAKNV